MKTTEELRPNYAPVYAAALYPELAKIFQGHGYALACHGSLARDFDLVAVPWAQEVSSPTAVLKEITTKFWIRQIGEPENKRHQRLCFTISVGHGDCAIDLSFVALPESFPAFGEIDTSKPLEENPQSDAKDALFDEAAIAVRTLKNITTNNLRLKLKCTYSKASMLMEQLEAHGIISPKDGVKPRKVL